MDFSNFNSILDATPSVILTDSCAKIATGVAQLLPHTTHLLCVWHIFMNFERHIYHLVPQEKWIGLKRMF
jgi:hypothetical protein